MVASHDPIRLGVVGVGNCASSLIQGIYFYSDERFGTANSIPGLAHWQIGPYKPSSVVIAAAFDVDASKVNRDVSEAIFCPPNNTLRFADVPKLDVNVSRGPTLDGLGQSHRTKVAESLVDPSDVAAILRDTQVDVVISYLPTGSDDAAYFYAEAALEANCAFVNCMPTTIAGSPTWSERFAGKRLPLVGDDIKSQLGATILHRMLLRLMNERGLDIEHTYQLNHGGNTDFLNMLDKERVAGKKRSKAGSLQSQIHQTVTEDAIQVELGHIPWLGDRKWASIHVEGATFGNAPVRVDVQLEVWDSPNSAGVAMDAIRCAGLAKRNGIGGNLIPACACFMKAPPQQMTDDEAFRLLEEFVLEESSKGDKAPRKGKP